MRHSDKYEFGDVVSYKGLTGCVMARATGDMLGVYFVDRIEYVFAELVTLNKKADQVIEDFLHSL